MKHNKIIGTSPGESTDHIMFNIFEHGRIQMEKKRLTFVIDEDVRCLTAKPYSIHEVNVAYAEKMEIRGRECQLLHFFNDNKIDEEARIAGTNVAEASCKHCVNCDYCHDCKYSNYNKPCDSCSCHSSCHCHTHHSPETTIVTVTQQQDTHGHYHCGHHGHHHN